jgi:F-type H+-transporting ATPase subunit gamma
MPILKEIKENLKAIVNIEAVTKTYQEIANLRMNKIRQEVLDNRELTDELSRIYTLAKKAYTTQPKNKKTAKARESSIKRKKQRVVLFLSCNERFHGTLILDIWKEIFNFLAENKADLAVVGRIGKYLAERGGFGHKMFYFELDDDEPEKERIKGIIEFIKNYRQIIIFHGRFQTILFQKVVQTDISGGAIQEKKLGEIKNYLFEPSPEAVLDFFETELILAFFNQTILEHRLSRYATRMIAMYQATGSAKERRKELETEQKKLTRQLLNKKQIEMFSGFQLWA